MALADETPCPGCGLWMPVNPRETYDGYFNCSAACWYLFTEIVGHEFANPAQMGNVHQLTVDSYAVQHAGGNHPDKSVAIHLVGLHLALEQGLSPPLVAPLLQRLASSIKAWPHFPPPVPRDRMLTILDIALVDEAEHGRVVREWAESLWRLWVEAHPEIRKLASQHL